MSEIVTSAIGVAVNNSGTVAGFYVVTDPYWGNYDLGFSFSNGVLTDIGTLDPIPDPSLPPPSSKVYGMNASGAIVGSSLNSDERGNAFVYSNGTMTDLGTLGGFQSTALAINDAGTIVGYSQTATGTYDAFVVYSGGTMTDLNTLVDIPGERWSAPRQ